jgi:hypothetical protein
MVRLLGRPLLEVAFAKLPSFGKCVCGAALPKKVRLLGCPLLESGCPFSDS